MQLVFIEGLKINTVIGVYDWERVIKQELIIDAKMHCDMTEAMASDDVNHVINYKTVCEDIETICHETQAELLESLADKIATHILTVYPCHKIDLTIKKPGAVKQASSVGVQIVRER